MPSTRQVVSGWSLLLLSNPLAWQRASKGHLFPLFYPHRPPPLQPRPTAHDLSPQLLPSLLPGPSWGHMGSCRVLAQDQGWAFPTVGFLGPRREPSEEDRTSPSPAAFWPALESVREAGVGAGSAELQRSIPGSGGGPGGGSWTLTQDLCFSFF